MARVQERARARAGELVVLIDMSHFVQAWARAESGWLAATALQAPVWLSLGTFRKHLPCHIVSSPNDTEVEALKAYVAVTDKTWFQHLRKLSLQTPVDEVNFWTPKSWGGRFRVLQRGQPLLFKLRSPDNAIVGGGFYEHYSDLPISLAWEAFGEKNGASSLSEIRQRTARLRRDAPRP